MKTLKDWRDQIQYQYTEDHTLRLWAWEFLRRNENYVKEWQEELPGGLMRIENILNNNGMPWDNKKHLKDYTPDKPDFHIPSMTPRERWGIMAYVNPDQDKPSFRALTFLSDTFHTASLTNDTRNGMNRNDEKETHIFLNQYEIAYAFNMELPLKPQMEKAKKFLSRIQKEFKLQIKKSKRHKDNWLTYLRILDAYSEGVKPAIIAKILFPKIPNEHPDYNGTNRVKDSYNQAMELVNGGYLKIVLP